MKVEEFDGAREQEALFLCVKVTEFLSRVAGRIGKDPWRAKSSNLIWKWSEEYFARYKQAPDREIMAPFQEWARKSGKDEASHKNIDRLLSWILDREVAKSLSLAHALDRAQEHLNDVRLGRHLEELTRFREQGQVREALVCVQSFVKLDLESAPYVDVLRDLAAHKEALEASQRVLVEMPGAAGEFFGNELSENAFVAFMAAAKGGKSYALLDIAWRAFRQGRKVAYFQVGDLSRDQIIRRFQRRIVYRKLEPGIFQKPVRITVPSESRGLAVVEYEQKEFTREVSFAKLNKAIETLAGSRPDPDSGGELRLSYHPIKTVSTVDIKNILDSWDQSGFQSQVICVDYAGNLAHSGASRDFDNISQTAHTWAMLRQLSEVRKCLVVTANQTNKEGFTSWVLTRKNFADSKMILAHCTAFLGVNMTDEEKQRGILRYNFVVRREDAYSESFCLYAGSYLAAADPLAVTTLPPKGFPAKLG